MVDLKEEVLVKVFSFFFFQKKNFIDSNDFIENSQQVKIKFICDYYFLSLIFYIFCTDT